LTTNPSNEHFAAVVMPHLDDAYALARWLSGNNADAEDIVQEASLRALRGLNRLPAATLAPGFSPSHGHYATEACR